jgi:hypothetical protein
VGVDAVRRNEGGCHRSSGDRKPRGVRILGPGAPTQLVQVANLSLGCGSSTTPGNAAAPTSLLPPGFRITTGTLPNGIRGVAYSTKLTALGGVPPLVWTSTTAPPSGLALYNVRPGLDHLTAVLVPAPNRRSVMFPIFREGVWSIAYEKDESVEWTKAQER